MNAVNQNGATDYPGSAWFPPSKEEIERRNRFEAMLSWPTQFTDQPSFFPQGPAQENLELCRVGKDGKTGLMLAANCPADFRAIVAGAVTKERLAERDDFGWSCFHRLMRSGAYRGMPQTLFDDEAMMTPDAEGFTPLHHAAMMGNLIGVPKRYLRQEVMELANPDTGVTVLGAWMSTPAGRRQLRWLMEESGSPQHNQAREAVRAIEAKGEVKRIDSSYRLLKAKSSYSTGHPRKDEAGPTKLEVERAAIRPAPPAPKSMLDFSR